MLSVLITFIVTLKRTLGRDPFDRQGVFLSLAELVVQAKLSNWYYIWQGVGGVVGAWGVGTFSKN